MLDKQQEAFARVLDLVEDAGCMHHVILIGSWAEFAYREAGLLGQFDPNIRTLDVDFLIRNLHKPRPAASLATMARERGFIVESDRLDGSTRLFDTTGLEVEFLIGKIGAGLESTLKTNVGVTAQALRHLDVLLRDTIEIPCLGHMLRVPSPEAYVVHKMVINCQRGVKAEKDRDAILRIWPLLDRQRVEITLASLHKKERARADEFMRSNKLCDK